MRQFNSEKASSTDCFKILLYINKIIIFVLYLIITLRKIRTKMRVSYGFVYFFTVGMIAATLLLSVLLIKSIRHFFFGLTRKHKISSNQFLVAGKYIIFAIIFAILIDSIITYKTYSDDLSLGIHLK